MKTPEGGNTICHKMCQNFLQSLRNWLQRFLLFIFLSRLNMVAVWNNDGKFEMLREVSDLLANDESGDEDEDGGDDSS